MEDIIKKAIEGGWKSETPSISTGSITEYPKGKHRTWYWQDVKGAMNFRAEEIVCNPLFWQALGKAEGWEELQWKTRAISVNHFFYQSHKPLWNYYYYKFHEINLTEGWESAVTYLRSVCGLK